MSKFEKKDNKDCSKTTKKGSSKKYNGRKSKPNNNKDKVENSTEKLEGNINDASYYFSNPDLLSQVSNFSFNEYLGVPADYDMDIDINSKHLTVQEKVTNVVTFYMNPSVQPTGYASSARFASINVIGYKNFLLLSANNAKTTAYAPQDVTCLILAIGQVLAMYSFLKRPFGCIYLINPRNRSYPELLFKAMGINFDDFKSNVADYRIKFNQLIAMFDRIPFFSDVPYFDKCIKMFDNIYVDEDTPLAQTYMFVPQTTWIINEAYDPQGTGLDTKWVVEKGVVKTFGDYLNIFADMINALATSTTFNAIFSDVLRVVGNGKGKTLLLEILSEMYSIKPVINDEVRHWINNARFIHVPDDKDAFPGSLGVGATNFNDVASLADQNSILYNPIFSLVGNDHDAGDMPDDENHLGRRLMIENDLVNFDGMDPSIEDRISSTRLAVRGEVVKTPSTVEGRYFWTLTNIGLGDYYCSGMGVYVDVSDAGLVIHDNVIEGNGAASASNFIHLTDKMSKLKYSPRLYYTDGGYFAPISDGDNLLWSTLGDLSYYTFLDFKYMKRLKDVEALTLFSINA